MKRQGMGWMGLVVLVGCSLTPQAGWGWGQEGHKIVGKIAEARLNDAAKNALAEITDLPLGSDTIANWADKIAHMAQFAEKFEHNNLWHFVDIPLEADGYDADREAQNVAKRLKSTVDKVGKDNNVIEQITIWRKVLADKNAPTFKRMTALRFLVHFHGDITQPLHCATHNDDAGGNGVPAVYLNIHGHHLNLHHVWDVNLVQEIIKDQDLDVVAYQLNQKIKPADAAKWVKDMDPKSWANESHQLAKTVAYVPVIEQDANAQKPVRLDMAYVQKAVPVVQSQLQKAGVRLAKTLNDALATP